MAKRRGGDTFEGDIIIGSEKTLYKDSQATARDAGKIECRLVDTDGGQVEGIVFIQGIWTVTSEWVKVKRVAP